MLSKNLLMSISIHKLGYLNYDTRRSLLSFYTNKFNRATTVIVYHFYVLKYLIIINKILWFAQNYYEISSTRKPNRSHYGDVASVI